MLGILVVYPLLDLRRYKQDLHWYLRQIEEVIIQVLYLYDIAAYRDEDTGTLTPFYIFFN
jgi:lipoyl(octanoyl) transferase